MSNTFDNKLYIACLESLRMRGTQGTKYILRFYNKESFFYASSSQINLCTQLCVFAPLALEINCGKMRWLDIAVKCFSRVYQARK